MGFLENFERGKKSSKKSELKEKMENP